MSAYNVSVIVPVLNEAEQLESLARRLRILQGEFVKEIIVVDGGSHDETVTFLEKEFNVVQSAKGRAKQMNAGAAQATGTWLFFLHADTILSHHHLTNALSDATLSKWGRFDVRLSGDHPAFRVIEYMINLRSRLSGIATGDQCIFVRRALFEQLGGFADIPIMEDIELCRRLKSHGKPACIEDKVITSSRKWEQEGIVKTVWLMWKMRLAYWLGAKPENLVKQYYRS